jgi:hypothetical protein
MPRLPRGGYFAYSVTLRACAKSIRAGVECLLDMRAVSRRHPVKHLKLERTSKRDDWINRLMCQNSMLTVDKYSVKTDGR